ncbi:MAG: urease accessory protein UreF [Proteobacteria bacterium]|jgi:urease accessory protein|nr:urease accessory protein UreF [Pseudomonadota bacterium]MDA1150914.1 urease accessory protein UreF [Pseudomonadota bacterium]
MAELTDTIRQTQLLAALFSPAFPIGAFSYSHGIEAAIASGDVDDAATAHDWIETILLGGSGRNDAILMANAYNAVKLHAAKDGQLAGGRNAEIEAINELAFALSSGAERAQESRELGVNFARIVDQVYQLDISRSTPLAYPVAAGLVVRYLGCDLTLGLTFFLQSFIANLISVVVRAVPLGQSDGQIMLAQMMPAVATLANEAALAPLDDVGGYAILADHASIIHETLEPRIYRT